MSEALEGKTIAHIVRSAGTGGVETHVKSLVAMLSAIGARPTVVSLAATPPHPDFEQLGCPVTTLSDAETWGWSSVRAAIELRGLLRRIAPDIVHLHGARPIFVGAVAARTAGCGPIIAALHGAHNLMSVREDGTTSAPGRLLARVCHGTGFALSDRILLCAHALMSDARACLNAVTPGSSGKALDKVRVFHHGIDTARFAGPSARAAELRDTSPDRAFVVGTLSRLDEPKKGLAVLLNAISMLQERGHNLRLRVAGSGHSRSALERLAKELNLVQIEFLGFVDDPGAFYESLDAFVMPSLSEGMPLTNLEAMASRLPVVTTDVGGAAEAVLHRSTGLVVPPGDASAIAKALELLVTEPGLARQLGDAGESRVRRYFSNEVMFEAICRVYREVLSESASGGIR